MGNILIKRNMNSRKVDITELKTVGHYARIVDKDRQTIYNWIKEGKVKVVIIDGIKFVQLIKSK